MKQSKMIRSVFTAFLASSLLAGCSPAASAGSQSSSAAGDVQSGSAETSAKAPSGSYTAVWYAEPSWQLNGVAELMAQSAGGQFGVYEEKTGYSQQWKDLFGTFSSAVQDYETDAIMIIDSGSVGIMNYEGYILYAPDHSENQTITYAPAAGYVVNQNKDTQDGQVLSSNYMTTSAVTKDQKFFSGLDGNNKYVKNGILWDAMTDSAAMFYNAKTRAVLNAGSSYDNPTGSALVGTDGNVIAAYNYPLRTDCYTFVNGFVEVTNGTGYGVLDSGTGTLVTKKWYTDMKWFQEGFCPVCEGSKWGLIDQYGNEVLECVFDDVSAVVNGKAFVGIKGIYGILDITETAALGITGNLDNCYPDGTPDPASFKSAEYKFKGGICGGDVVTQDSSLSNDTGESALTGAKGKVKVNVTGLRIRADHTTSSASLGNVDNGGVYYYYDTYNDGTYTWYKIGDSQWIADTGEWLTVFGTDVFGTATVHVIDLIIHTDSSTSSPRIGYAEYGKTYDVYAFYQDSDYQWLKIGDNAWVANNGEWVTVTKY